MLEARLLNCSPVTLQSEILSSLMLRQLASTACTVTRLRGILDTITTYITVQSWQWLTFLCW